MLCLQQQLDLLHLAHLAQPLLILPARRGTAEKLPQGVNLWWDDPGRMPGAHQSRSIAPPPQLDRGENIKRKARGSR